MNMNEIGVVIVVLIMLSVIGYLNYKSIIARSKSLIKLVEKSEEKND